MSDNKRATVVGDDEPKANTSTMSDNERATVTDDDKPKANVSTASTTAPPNFEIPPHICAQWPPPSIIPVFEMATVPYKHRPQYRSYDNEIDDQLEANMRAGLHAVDLTTNDVYGLIDKINMVSEGILLDQKSLRPWGALNPAIRDSLLQLSPERAELYYTSFFVYKDLIRAWIWRLLREHLFCSPDRWEGPAWKGFGALMSVFSSRAGTIDMAVTRSPISRNRTSNPETYEAVEDGPNGPAVMREQQYHYWRIFTQMMMRHDLKSKPDTTPHTSITRLTGVLMGKLAEVIDETKYPPHEYEDRVRMISSAAACFDLSCLQARCNLMVAWRLPGVTEAGMVGFPFTPSGAIKKEVGKGKEGDPIDFVISPGIFLSGDVMGIHYDEGCWMKAMEVAVNEFPDGVGEDFVEVEESDQDEPGGTTLKLYRRDASGRLVSVS